MKHPNLLLPATLVLLALMTMANSLPSRGAQDERQPGESHLPASRPATRPSFSFWPPSPEEPRIQFLRCFSSSDDLPRPATAPDKANLAGEIRFAIGKPWAVRMWRGRIYVCDVKHHSIIVFDLKKQTTGLLGSDQQARFDQPTDLAIADDGTKYVADLNAGAIVVFSADDRRIQTFDLAEFKPVSVASFKDELAVIDFKAAKLELLERKTGKLLRSIGERGMKDGQHAGPVSVAYDSKGILHVVDALKSRVQKFDREGRFIAAFGSSQPVPGGFVRPKQIAIDPEDNAFVADAAFQNVQVFDAEGRLQNFFGGAGLFEGSMSLPAGVAISDDPDDLALFKDQVHPCFHAQRVVLVTSQFGPPRVSVYAWGRLKPGKKVADLTEKN